MKVFLRKGLKYNRLKVRARNLINYWQNYIHPVIHPFLNSYYHTTILLSEICFYSSPFAGLKYHYISGPKKLNYTWIVQWVDPPPRELGSAHMIFGERSVLIYIMIAVCTVVVIGGLIAAAIVCRNRREGNAPFVFPGLFSYVYMKSPNP